MPVKPNYSNIPRPFGVKLWEICATPTCSVALALFNSPDLIHSQEATHTHTPPQIIGPNTPQQTPDSGVRIRATSRLVIVYVVVTDSHVNPIHDLKREDFKLTESSNPQEIRDFEQVTPSKPPLTIAPKMPSLSPNVYINFQEAPAGEPAINLLLLDALSTLSQTR